MAGVPLRSRTFTTASQRCSDLRRKSYAVAVSYARHVGTDKIRGKCTIISASQVLFQLILTLFTHKNYLLVFLLGARRETWLSPRKDLGLT